MSGRAARHLVAALKTNGINGKSTLEWYFAATWVGGQMVTPGFYLVPEYLDGQRFFLGKTVGEAQSALPEVSKQVRKLWKSRGIGK